VVPSVWLFSGRDFACGHPLSPSSPTYPGIVLVRHSGLQTQTFSEIHFVVCTPDTYWNQRVLRTENTVPWIHKPHRKIPMRHSVFSGRPRPASGEFKSAPASTADFKRRRRSLAWRTDKSSCRSDVSCETTYRAGLI
jgi:hypothetical protein